MLTLELNYRIETLIGNIDAGNRLVGVQHMLSSKTVTNLTQYSLFYSYYFGVRQLLLLISVFVLFFFFLCNLFIIFIFIFILII